MKLEEINTSKAPLPVGPYSQAVKVGNFIFCSGQIGIDPKDGRLVEGIAEQTKQALENLSAVLNQAGAVLDDVVRVDIFLTDITDFQDVNSVYERYFFKNPKPSRQTVGVLSLPKKAKVEISCIAVTED